jgi:hypothetical protein
VIFVARSGSVREFDGIDTCRRGFERDVRVDVLHIQADIGAFKVIIDSDLFAVRAIDLQDAVQRGAQTAGENFSNDPLVLLSLETEHLFLSGS